VLLYGANEYLIDYYIDLYKSELDAKESMLTLYFDEWDFTLAKTYLSQTSLFGGTNLLIVKNDKKIPKKELDRLIELVQKSSDNYFLFEYKGVAKDAKSLQASFSPKKGANWLRLFEPSLRENIAFLQRKSTHIKLEIDHYALQHLLLLLNNNLALCANELNKLAILKGKVTSKDIDRLSTPQLLWKSNNCF
jgi:DNA polymerase-3 subunit delta